MKTKELRMHKCPICPLDCHLSSDKDGNLIQTPIYGDCCFPDGMVTEKQYNKLLINKEKMREQVKFYNSLSQKVKDFNIQIKMLSDEDRKLLYKELDVKEIK